MNMRNLLHRISRVAMWCVGSLLVVVLLLFVYSWVSEYRPELVEHLTPLQVGQHDELVNNQEDSISYNDFVAEYASGEAEGDTAGSITELKSLSDSALCRNQLPDTLRLVISSMMAVSEYVTAENERPQIWLGLC